MQQALHNKQNEARSKAQHYNESCEFYGMFGANSFDEEVLHSKGWMGLVRDEDGMLQVYAEYVLDDIDTGDESGTGWWL